MIYYVGDRVLVQDLVEWQYQWPGTVLEVVPQSGGEIFYSIKLDKGPVWIQSPSVLRLHGKPCPNNILKRLL